MSKKNSELIELDLYELLGVDITSSENEIKKSYRKHALACHPDKNPDNPKAAEEFDKLKKILEILLDSDARAAYDKVLKGRKAAALRAKAADKKTQVLKSKLEERERAHSTSKPVLTEEEKLKQEIIRLEEEGLRLIEEELEKDMKKLIEKIALAEKRVSEKHKDVFESTTFKIRASWEPTSTWPGFKISEIQELFYKWGEIKDLKLMETSDNCAIIEYKDKTAADMAVQFEKGFPDKPIKPEHYEDVKPKQKDASSGKRKRTELPNTRDYESINEMNARRAKERAALLKNLIENE